MQPMSHKLNVILQADILLDLKHQFKRFTKLFIEIFYLRIKSFKSLFFGHLQFSNEEEHRVTKP